MHFTGTGSCGLLRWIAVSWARTQKANKGTLPDNSLELPPACVRWRSAVLQVELHSEYFQFVLCDFCHVEPQPSLLELAAPLGLGLKDVLLSVTDDTEVVEVHEATSRRLRAVSPGCRSVLQRWQNCPDSANGGEPLIDALCQVERPIEAHRQHAPTRVHQRGFEERDPVKYPADDIELSSGEQRERKERVHPPRSLHPALRKQSFTSAVAANIVGVTLRKTGDVSILPRQSVEASRTSDGRLEILIWSVFALEQHQGIAHAELSHWASFFRTGLA